MPHSYFPSCNFTRLMPEVSARLSRFLASRGVNVLGCCRRDHGKIAGTPLTICQTCRIIIDENHPDAGCVSVFEYIDALPDFPFPDWRGAAMTVQDCYRAKAHDGERRAMRSLLRKLNVEIVELPDAAETRDFDGDWLFSPVRPANRALAPRRFAEIERDVRPMSPEAAAAWLRDYCARFETDAVVCACNSCLTGLRQGLPEGRAALHLAQLLFPGAESPAPRPRPVF